MVLCVFLWFLKAVSKPQTRSCISSDVFLNIYNGLMWLISFINPSIISLIMFFFFSYVCVCVSLGGYAPAVRVQQSSHTQPQAVLGTYSPVASHQCSMVQVNTQKVSLGISLKLLEPREETLSLNASCSCSQHQLCFFLSLSLCREAFRCPFPKVKLWPG